MQRLKINFMVSQFRITVNNVLSKEEEENTKTYLGLQREFVNMWNDELGYRKLKESINTKQNILEKTQTRNELINNMIIKSYYFDEEISRFIYRRYLCFDQFVDLINLFEEPRLLFNHTLNIVKKLKDIYIEYLVGFVDFYNNYAGFNYVFSYFIAEQIDKPFYEHYDKDCKLLVFDKCDFKYLYLRLIKNIFDANFIPKPSEEEKRNIVDTLLEIESFGTEKEARLAKQIRFKIHRYKGIKYPEWFVFASNIKEEESLSLAEYVKERFVNETVNVGTLKAFFRGRLSIVNDYDSIYYGLTELVSGPIKIKSKKIGYIAFIWNHLFVNGYVVCNNLWKDISCHNFFVNKNGKTIDSNQFAAAFSDKFQNLNIKVNGIVFIDPTLQELNEFLNNTLPKRN